MNTSGKLGNAYSGVFLRFGQLLPLYQSIEEPRALWGCSKSKGGEMQIECVGGCKGIFECVRSGGG